MASRGFCSWDHPMDGAADALIVHFQDTVGGRCAVAAGGKEAAGVHVEDVTDTVAGRMVGMAVNDAVRLREEPFTSMVL